MNNVVPIETFQPQRPRDYSASQLALIRRTIAKDCNGDEFDMFMEVCRRVGLDPFRRQIYAFVFNKDNEEKRQLSIVTGIGGYRAIAQRCGDYRPDDQEPVIEYDESVIDPATNPLGIVKAVVKAYKQDAKGQWNPVIGRAYWDEYAPVREIWRYSQEAGKRQPTGEFELAKENWRKMPKIMIAKCAEAQALQKGWPEDLSGLYSEEEMHQAMARDASASEVVAHEEETRRLARVHAKDAIPIQWSAGEPIEFIPIGQIADRLCEFAQKAGSEAQINAFKEINQNGLRQFWAVAQGEALEVKKRFEERSQKLLEAPA